MSWVDVTTAVGTAGAAVVALALGLWGIYSDRLRKRDEELRQARLVVIGEPYFLGRTPEGARPVAIKVYNYSNAPIHQVGIGIDIWRAGLSNRKPDDHEGIELDFLAPQEEQEFFFNLPDESDACTGALSFLDSSGRRFERKSYQPEPQRILHPPQLRIQIIDGEAVITVVPHTGRIRNGVRVFAQVIRQPINGLRNSHKDDTRPSSLNG